MKILKIILILIAVAVGGFLAVGLIKPSIDYGVTVEVSRSPEVAWAVYLDTSLLREWVPEINSIKQVSGGDEMVGSVYEISMDHEGQPVITMEEVTAYEENKRMAMIFTNDLMTLDNEVVFAPKEDGGTTVILIC